MGTGYGSQHSMDPAGIFATSPGWRIVAPSTAYDYIGLMNAALALEDPVVVLEHVDLYGTSGPIPASELDIQLPLGEAAVRREGNDVTVLSYLSMVSTALTAVEQEGIDAEVIDLRWLDRASLDWATIEGSVRKTNAVVIVEQGAQGTSYGAWLADALQRRLFDWLDQPVQRVTGGEAFAEHLPSPRAGRLRDGGRCRRRPSPHRFRIGELMAHILTMPEVLTGATEARLSTWTVAVGNAVADGDTVAEVETDKAVVDLPSTAAGTVGQLLVDPGTIVDVGTPLLVLLADGESLDDVELPDGTGESPAMTAAEERPPSAAAPVAEQAREICSLVGRRVCLRVRAGSRSGPCGQCADPTLRQPHRAAHGA